MLNGTDLFRSANGRQKAIPAFDVAGGNVDILHAICHELAVKKACAFLASTPASILAYLGYNHFVGAVEDVSKQYGVDVATHLDHATELGEIDAALSVGFTSIMFDGSRLPFGLNLELTQKIVEKAHALDISVEAELGTIAGKEDNVAAPASMFPTVEESRRFVAETKVDFFAPAIGTCHGFYNRAPNIQWNLAQELSSSLATPMVLHGATGLSPGTVTRLLKLNFAKINFATGIRAAFYSGVRERINQGNASMKPQSFLESGRKSVARFARNILELVV